MLCKICSWCRVPFPNGKKKNQTYVSIHTLTYALHVTKWYQCTQQHSKVHLVLIMGLKFDILDHIKWVCKVPITTQLFSSSSFLCDSLVQTSRPAQLRLLLPALQIQVSRPPAHQGTRWPHECGCWPLLAAALWLDWRWGPPPWWWDRMKETELWVKVLD